MAGPLRTAAPPREIDWSRWTDGRVWRLKRGRDFDCSADAFRAAAGEASQALGKPVRIVRDKIEPTKIVWLQFADYEITTRQPCPCGSTVIYRRHAGFGHCGECGSLLLLVTPPSVDEPEVYEPLELPPGDETGNGASGADGDGEPDPKAALRAVAYDDPGRRLERFRDVHLKLYETVPGRAERYAGFGLDQTGRPTLFLVTVPLMGGQRIPLPGSPLGCQYKLTPWPLEPVHEVLDVEALQERLADEWDIVLP